MTVFSFIYQILYNGLDFNRLWAPEHIIEKSSSSMFWFFYFFGESVCWILAFGGVNKAYGGIRMHTDAYGCIFDIYVYPSTYIYINIYIHIYICRWTLRSRSPLRLICQRNFARSPPEDARVWWARVHLHMYTCIYVCIFISLMFNTRFRRKSQKIKKSMNLTFL